jgi:DNA repair protein RadC
MLYLKRPRRRRHILAHNHRSGVAKPSHADEAITRRLRESLSLVDIKVLDHIIVANLRPCGRPSYSISKCI